METRFDITVRHRGPVVVVHPRGRLTVHSATALHEILAKKLRNHGQVVVDLDGFALDHAAGVDIFPAVMTECGGWPVAKLVLCRLDPQMAQVLTTRPDQAPAVFPTSAAQHCCPGTAPDASTTADSCVPTS